MKRNNNTIFFVLLCFGLFSSCVNEKRFIYFQKGNSKTDTILGAKTYISKIQPGDILSIYVTSLSNDASVFFNPYAMATATAQGTSEGVATSVAPGYLVDPLGNIELPLIKTVKVSGLNTTEIRDSIKIKLTKYLKEPTVNVRVLNYRVSVLGDVAKPSVYVIPNESVTLPEAISLAGDLNVTGRRDNILVVRDNNGVKEFGRVDLTSRNIYKSPYYYLHANDLVYVQPGKNKAAEGTFAYRIIPFVLGIASAALLIFVRLK